MCAATGILPQKNVGCFLSGGFRYLQLVTWTVD